MSRFAQQGLLEDIDEVIQLHREILALCVPSHADHVRSLNDLATVFHIRFERQAEPQDLDEAIMFRRQALTFCPAPHPDYYNCLTGLAMALTSRFEQWGGPENESFELHTETQALLRLQDPPDPHSSLSNVATAVKVGMERRGNLQDIEEAIKLLKEVLGFHAAPHPDRGSSLNNLAHAIQARFQQQGKSLDLEEVVGLRREALALDEHPDCTSLGNLANVLYARFEKAGDVKDIEEAIELNRKALALCMLPHPDRGSFLNNLGCALHARFEQAGGDLRGLEEAIALHREALALRALPHSAHVNSLKNLAHVLQTRFGHQGDPKDIDETIELHRTALSIPTLAHSERASSVLCLSAALHARFKHWGDSKNLDESLELLVGSLPLLAVPHPKHGTSLLNLAYVLQTRSDHQGDLKDLGKAIEVYREGLALHPSSHPNHAGILNNLANALSARFEKQGDPRDLDETIRLHRDALALYPAPHPYRSMSLKNLASVVNARFHQLGNIKDLFEVIKLFEEVLAIHTSPHPQRGAALMCRGASFALLYLHTKNSYALNKAFSLFQEAATYISSPPLTRFQCAYFWATIASPLGHSSSLTAYSTVIELLPQLAALHWDLPSRQQRLSTKYVTEVAAGACTCALSLGRYDMAIEFLEASRSVFWSQALHLRQSLDDLRTVRSDLWIQIAELSSELERASFRDTSRDSSINTANHQKSFFIQAEGARSFRLNQEWEETIKSIRLVSGFEDFLQPKKLVQLQQAVQTRQIVVLHCGEISSNALVIKLGGVVECIPLPKLPHFAVQDLVDMLNTACTSTSIDIEDLFNTHQSDMTLVNRSLFTRLTGIREDSATGSVSANSVFAGILEILWDSLVLPILDVLHLERSSSPPRLWWCPTGPFAFLPIHAAGIYQKGSTNCVADYIISSYTPTITALLNPPSQPAPTFKMTAVIQPDAPNCLPLPGAERELEKIAERVPKQWLTVLGDTSPATVSTALHHLHNSSIVHFACHGIQNLQQPLNSGLALADGYLKVSQIMQGPEGEHPSDIKKHMSLAFLSACETAKGDKTTPDEAMHLAATLLFAGFRGVVATMWAMDDRDGPKIADTFYQHLFENCDPTANPPICPDLTEGAKALHLAVAKLREEPDIPFKRWVPFVYY
ncbi:CHAT domain-containing protein, partial [Mycena rosella]